MRPRAFVLLLLACLAGCAQTPPSYVTPRERDHPLVGKVWLPAAARFATPEELVAQARAADVVLLGETHDNADHHALQAWMLGRLLDTGRSRLVAFEMIDAGQQPALERHLAERPADVAGLAAALDWGKSGWPDWELYRPIFEVALRGGSQVTAANLTRPQVRAIAKEENAVTLPPLSAGQRAAMEREIKDSHCGMLPDAALPGMVRVQRGRDAVMAATLAQGLAGGKGAVLIAGAGHVRRDRGVPALLADRTPEARILSLAFLEVRPGETDPASYGALFDSAAVPFDAVWFTPRAEREDPCEDLRQHMEKKKEMGN